METKTVQGVEIPAVGLGTWRLTGRTCRQAVERAIELGYRHIDTAEAYGNEREVGAAIEAADVDREDLFVTTKVMPNNAAYEDAYAAIDDSRTRLGLDTIDMVLLHWPNPLVDITETLSAFRDAVEDGLVDHVGVSNFSKKRLDRARLASPVPILANQVQFNPYTPQRELLRYCQNEDIMLVGYSPLGHGGVTADRRLQELAAKYDRTPAQVAIRWSTQHKNVVTIPKATSERHQRENLETFDFSMTEAELDDLASPSTTRRWLSMVRGRLA